MKSTNLKKAITLLLSLLIIGALLCGCKSSSISYTTDEENKYADKIPGGVGDVNDDYLEIVDIDTKAEVNQLESRKLIRTVDIDAETKEFSKVMTSIEKAVNDAKGYVQNQSVNSNYQDNRTATMTLRIPADKLDGFLSTLNKAVNVTRQNSNVNDVTDEYVDIESHIAALETEQTALMAMLEKAEKLDDIIAIQSRLTEVRGNLESDKARQKGYDTLIAYSTVDLNLDEVERETESKPTFWSKAGNAFIDGITYFGDFVGGLAIFLIGALPFLIVIGGVTVGIILITKRSCKRKAAKKQTDKEEK